MPGERCHLSPQQLLPSGGAVTSVLRLLTSRRCCWCLAPPRHFRFRSVSFPDLLFFDSSSLAARPRTRILLRGCLPYVISTPLPPPPLYSSFLQSLPCLSNIPCPRINGLFWLPKVIQLPYHVAHHSKFPSLFLPASQALLCSPLFRGVSSTGNWLL